MAIPSLSLFSGGLHVCLRDRIGLRNQMSWMRQLAQSSLPEGFADQLYQLEPENYSAQAVRPFIQDYLLAYYQLMLIINGDVEQEDYVFQYTIDYVNNSLAQLDSWSDGVRIAVQTLSADVDFAVKVHRIEDIHDYIAPTGTSMYRSEQVLDQLHLLLNALTRSAIVCCQPLRVTVGVNQKRSIMEFVRDRVETLLEWTDQLTQVYVEMAALRDAITILQMYDAPHGFVMPPPPPQPAWPHQQGRRFG